MQKIINAHRFFVTYTPEYVGKIYKVDIYGHEHYNISFKDKIYYPIAYIKFMWSTLITN